MHRCTAPSLLPLLHRQPPRAATIFASSLHLSSTRSAAAMQRIIALLSPRSIRSWNSIAAATSPPLAARAYRQIFSAARCFSASLFALQLSHFSSHVPRCQCVACSLAPFTFTATLSLCTAAAVAALDAAIDAAESLCQRETFYFFLSRHSVFSHPVLACAHSCLCLLCVAVLCSCCLRCCVVCGVFHLAGG